MVSKKQEMKQILVNHDFVRHTLLNNELNFHFEKPAIKHKPYPETSRKLLVRFCLQILWQVAIHLRPSTKMVFPEK